MSITKYRALSQIESRVLYQVWRIEEELGMQKATRTRLAQALGIEPSYLAKIVSRIRRISEEAYLQPYRLHASSKPRRPSGPPRVYYELNGAHFATFPETAFLLLELLDYPKEVSRRVNSADFFRSMTANTTLDDSSISARVEWALQNDYLASDEDGAYIACQERTLLEKPYLELLAGHFDGVVTAVGSA